MMQSVIYEKKSGTINQVTTYPADQVKSAIDLKVFDAIDVDPDATIPTLESGYIDIRRVVVKKKKLIVNSDYVDVASLQRSRHDLLLNTDWFTWRHRDQIDEGEPTSLTEEQWKELLGYRSALRAWPVSGDYSEPFPVKPEWMK